MESVELIRRLQHMEDSLLSESLENFLAERVGGELSMM